MQAESEPESEATAEVRVEYSSVPEASDLTLMQPVGAVVREVEASSRTNEKPEGEYAGTAKAVDVEANKGRTARAVLAVEMTMVLIYGRQREARSRRREEIGMIANRSRQRHSTSKCLVGSYV